MACTCQLLFHRSHQGEQLPQNNVLSIFLSFWKAFIKMPNEALKALALQRKVLQEIFVSPSGFLPSSRCTELGTNIRCEAFCFPQHDYLVD